MKRYAVAVEGLNKDDEKALIEFLQEYDATWWHWIENFWLVLDQDDRLTTEMIRDHLQVADSSSRAIVIQIEVRTWHGFARKSVFDKFFQWIEKNLTRKV